MTNKRTPYTVSVFSIGKQCRYIYLKLNAALKKKFLVQKEAFDLKWDF